MSKFNFFALFPTRNVRSITDEQGGYTHPVLLQTRMPILPAHLRFTYMRVDAVAAVTFTEDFTKWAHFVTYEPNRKDFKKNCRGNV